MNLHCAKSREAVVDLHQWKWPGNDCSAPWVLEPQGSRPHPLLDPLLLSAVLHWFVLVWGCCSALVCSLMPGTAGWLSSLQYNTGPIHSARWWQSRACWGWTNSMQQCAHDLALSGASAVALGSRLALPFHVVRPRPPRLQTRVQQGDESPGAVGTGSARPALTPSLPVRLSLAPRLPLFIWGGKVAEHNLHHLWESLEPTWRHPGSAS